MITKGWFLGALGAAVSSVATVRAEPASLEPGRATLPSSVKEKVDASVGDGVYGRLDGDLELALGLGSEFDPSGPAGAGRLSAAYFWTAGVYATYADALARAPRFERTVSVGVDLRPLFVPRWSQNWEHGPALVDLTLDSLSLGFGVYWAKPGGGVGWQERGLEISLGGGVPLFGRARGLWLELRGLMRAAEAARTDVGTSLLVLLGWHELVSTPLSD
jgi:hypothetical protein